jgi:putative membrane protein
MMPSERRLHPLSFLFQIGGQLQQFVVPGLLLLFGARSAGMEWQGWIALALVPSALAAIVKTFSFRYRFEETELVMTSGFVFRKVRHVPYARVQNIDARQNLVHRLVHVVEVRVETGGGEEPEAALRVLPLEALDEMRERVFAGRAAATATADRAGEAAASAGHAAPAETLLRLRPRDLLLAGFVDSRGLIIVGAAFGLLWEFGLFDRSIDFIAGENVSGRGLVRRLIRAAFGGGVPPPRQILLTLGGFAVLLLALRLLSMAWSFIRLYGFRLDRSGDDLRVEYGFFTRVMTTIPRSRIQTLTIKEGLFHRLFRRAAIRVDSAGGGDAAGQRAATRESLAPIVDRALVPRLLQDVLPDLDLERVDWQPVDPRGVRRTFVVSMVFYTFLTMPFVGMLRWWSLALYAGFVALAWVSSRMHVKHLGWAVGERAVIFRSGWLTRELTMARFTKVQVVTLRESPFDRRHQMASVRVDTAGASDLSHRVAIPFLSRPTADAVYEQLAAAAARTSFRW